MSAKFALEFMLAELCAPEARRVKPIPGMRPEAARGVLEAFDEGLLPDAAWNSVVHVVHYYDRLVVTAQGT